MEARIEIKKNRKLDPNQWFSSRFQFDSNWVPIGSWNQEARDGVGRDGGQDRNSPGHRPSGV